MFYRALDPFVALGAVAAVTERLVLGAGITLLIQRDVIHTAKQVATVDLLSGGRFLFGVGAGWNREEMTNHGTDPLATWTSCPAARNAAASGIPPTHRPGLTDT